MIKLNGAGHASPSTHPQASQGDLLSHAEARPNEAAVQALDLYPVINRRIGVDQPVPVLPDRPPGSGLGEGSPRTAMLRRQLQTSAISKGRAAGLSPFPECARMSDGTVRELARRIRQDGFFTIPLSEATQAFLDRLVEDDALPWTGGSVGRGKSFDGSPAADTITSFASRVFRELGLAGASWPGLKPTEMEVREAPGGPSGQPWHWDVRPKVFTCVATLRGPPTQYVSMDVARRCFAPSTGGIRHLTQTAEVDPSDIRTAPDRQMLFMFASAVDGDLPKLVHRTPPSDDTRKILLCRWKIDGRS